MDPVSLPPAVAALLTRGSEGVRLERWPEPQSLGLTPEHVPSLVTLARELSLHRVSEPQCWAPLHAWRALSKLAPEAAVEPVLATVAAIGDDWSFQDVRRVCASAGAAAVRPLAAMLADPQAEEMARGAASEGLAAVALEHPDLRAECVTLIAEQLSRYASAPRLLNALLVSALIDLHAVEHAGLIERAMAAGAVDEMHTGDWEDVAVEMGLIAERRTRRPPSPLDRYVRDDDATAPATSTKVDRNAPCPCGSGKKYKKCHGAAAKPATPPPARSPESLEADRVKTIDAELVAELMRYARTTRGEDWFESALDEYLGDSSDELREAEMQLAVPWSLYHWRDDAEPTVAERFRDSPRGKRLAAPKRAVLDAGIDAYVSVLFAREARPGEGLVVKDAFTGREDFVHEKSGSTTVRPGAALLGTVVRCGDVAFFGGMHPQPLPPREAHRALGLVEESLGFNSGETTAEQLRAEGVAVELIDVWRETAFELEHRPPPRFTNTDGDPLVLTTDHFVITSGSDRAAVARLTTLPGADLPNREEDRSTTITVSMPGNATHDSWDNTLVARIVVKGDEVRAETNSTARADRIRAAILAQLDGTIRFRLRDEVDQATMLERAARTQSSPSVGAAAEPELLTALREVKTRHMTAWLDESIPALGDLTPRAAAASAEWRGALRVLLDQMEYGEQGLAIEERFDVGVLRAELFPQDRGGAE